MELSGLRGAWGGASQGQVHKLQESLPKWPATSSLCQESPKASPQTPFPLSPAHLPPTRVSGAAQTPGKACLAHRPLLQPLHPHPRLPKELGEGLWGGATRPVSWHPGIGAVGSVKTEMNQPARSHPLLQWGPGSCQQGRVTEEGQR